MKQSRYAGAGTTKSTGATYTPGSLAAFVARQMVKVASMPRRGIIRVLDPAVGDGALLDALVRCLPGATRSRLEIVGHDTDPLALESALQRLRMAFPGLKVRLELGNFLDRFSRSIDEQGVAANDESHRRFDLVIANPPYVRTQIMGARQARELARAFGLGGRIDLYYPFLLAIASVMADGAVAGMITSNRFMTTHSGRDVRREVLSRFELLHVWDMGDSKPFEAAVLPAVLLARNAAQGRTPDSPIRFSSLYETRKAASAHAPDALSALDARDDDMVGIADGRCFHVRHGTLDHAGLPEGVWRVATDASERWLTTVAAHTWAPFRHIGRIRVGVKSTADKVFIRSDWDGLPGGRPELLRPLVTRHVARRFKADQPASGRQGRREILYPHVVVDGKREAVDLRSFPRARRYLAQHRHALESRSYLIAAGRRWYELWVPQDPAAWAAPKLVFPDISEKPVFWMDTDGGVVNGECYWLQCERDNQEDLLWLALAVANSSFIEAFYDHRFNNKLYAGRRRFITQYVEQFPLPDPASREARAIVKLARSIHACMPGAEADRLMRKLDARIWQVFGLSPP